MNRTLTRAGIPLALAGVLAVPSAAQASGSADAARPGSCTGSALSKLVVAKDNGRIEVEFEVESHRRGQAWRVAIFHDGQRIFSGTRTTTGPGDGSFRVRKLTANHAGRDQFRATAKRVGGTQTCTARASI